MIEKKPVLPGWVLPMSQVIIGLQRLGIAFFTFHVLSIPGRRSGLMRATVVSPFTVGGDRYILSFGQLDWVRNARVAGRGLLRRGCREERVGLEEVAPPESARIVRDFPLQVPAGVQFFVRLGLVEAPGRPDQFESAADRLAVFRIAAAPNSAWDSTGRTAQWPTQRRRRPTL
jgi:hypothetical protein